MAAGAPGCGEPGRPTTLTHPASDLASTSRSEPILTLAFGDGREVESRRSLAVEGAVNVVFGGVPFAVMMLTPADLEDFAYGFSLTEGVIEAASDIRGVRLEQDPDGLRLHVDLAPGRLHAHLARRRAMAGRTGCGVCGIEDLAHLKRARGRMAEAPLVRLAALGRALAELDAGQVLGAETRAVHAAAWADLDGHVTHVREDVGRHNALDKLIGALLREGGDPAAGLILITSRCSFEMVEKAASFGVRTVVAISAPTSLALERARAFDMTLAGIARQDSVTVFHGRERILAG